MLPLRTAPLPCNRSQPVETRRETAAGWAGADGTADALADALFDGRHCEQQRKRALVRRQNALPANDRGAGHRIGRGLSALGLVGALMAHSDTVGEALRVLEVHQRLLDENVIARLDVYDDVAVLTCACGTAARGGGRVPVQDALAAAARVLEDMCGPAWLPLEVLLPLAAPASGGACRRLFRAPVRFNQDAAALVFAVHWLSHRPAGADPARRQTLERRVAQLAAAHVPSAADELRQLMGAEIARTRCSASAMARRLSMHRRTLSRRLKEEGTCFRALAEELRFDLARHLLANTTMSLVEISATLQFSEPAAFTRAFRRWSGQAPSAWRAANAAAGRAA